jgi:hypothetical protein
VSAPIVTVPSPPGFYIAYTATTGNDDGRALAYPQRFDSRFAAEQKLAKLKLPPEKFHVIEVS